MKHLEDKFVTQYLHQKKNMITLPLKQMQTGPIKHATGEKYLKITITIFLSEMTVVS